MPQLDLSSFPLLRIDQITEHTTETLKESEQQLLKLQHEGEGIQTILPFVSKLVVHIRRELSVRARHKSPNPKRQYTPQRNNAARRVEYDKQQPTPTFFVPGSPESSATSFRSRSKQAKASLQARSQEAMNLKHETLRSDRTRAVLETMQEWRVEREQSKQRRELLLQEERTKARIQKRERRQHERLVRNSMNDAAEEAKSLALQSGSSPEEAVLEAAAAAAKVADDQSAAFNESDRDSDIDSLMHGSGCDEHSDLSLLEGSSHNTEAPATLDVREAETIDADSDASFNETDPRLETEVKKDTINRAGHAASVLQYDAIDLVDNKAEDRNYESFDADFDSDSKVDADQADVADNEADNTKDESLGSLTPTNACPNACEQNANGEVHVLKMTSPMHPEEQYDTPPDLFVEQTDESCNDDENKNSTSSRPKSKFTAAFPSIFHIFSQFIAGSRSKAAEKDCIRCLQSQVERCSRIGVLIDSDSFNDEPEMFYCIRSNRPEINNIISSCFMDRRMSRWEEAPHDGLWNLMWTWGMPKASDFENLLVFQKISRFRHTRGLTRKDLLKKNITKDGFNIMPLTYALPHEFNSFVKGFASVENASGAKRSNTWIIKPIGLSRGRGISLVNSVSDVSYSQPIVIQKYIDDPLCFIGYKFDLRVYVLVTSFNPLEAFIYKQGLARFGTRKYSASPQLLHDLRVHLTNSSIQKEFGSEIDKDHPAYLAGSNGAEAKVAMTWLFDRLDELGIDSQLLWQRISAVCFKALTAGGSDIPFQPNSFELFGFDLMFDQSLKCWLIEVNSSPSMSCDTALDTRIKGDLIRDTVLLVDPPSINQSALVDICNRRLSHRKEASNKSSGEYLEEDLRLILNDTLPRPLGTLPRLGAYERIAPGTELVV